MSDIIDGAIELTRLLELDIIELLDWLIELEAEVADILDGIIDDDGVC